MGDPIRKERQVGSAPVVDVRSLDGASVRQVELDPQVFALTPNVPVMHQVVTAQLAAARAGTQSTKTRAEVNGGSAKPWRQKGTGRARQGSIRAPHFSGGGVALGPKPRSYKQRTPKKMVQLALRSALSDRASEGKIIVVDNFDWETPKTKAAQAALTTFGTEGRVLVVLRDEDETAALAFRNIPKVQAIAASELNTYDVLRSDYVVFTAATLPVAEVPEVEGATRVELTTRPATSETETAETETPKAEAAETEEPSETGAAE